MNYCETNSHLTDKLNELSLKLNNEQNDIDRKTYNELLENYTSIAVVLHTLNDCTDSTIGWFGNKRKISIEKLFDAVNKYNSNMNPDLPELLYEHYEHKDFLSSFNSISIEVLGVTYQITPSDMMFEWEHLLWEDDSILEFCYYNLWLNIKSYIKSPVVIFVILLIPLWFFLAIIDIIDSSKRIKFNTSFRKL